MHTCAYRSFSALLCSALVFGSRADKVSHTWYTFMYAHTYIHAKGERTRTHVKMLHVHRCMHAAYQRRLTSLRQYLHDIYVCMYTYTHMHIQEASERVSGKCDTHTYFFTCIVAVMLHAITVWGLRHKVHATHTHTYIHNDSGSCTHILCRCMHVACHHEWEFFGTRSTPHTDAYVHIDSGSYTHILCRCMHAASHLHVRSLAQPPLKRAACGA